MEKNNILYLFIFVLYIGLLFQSTSCQNTGDTDGAGDVNATLSNSSVSGVAQSNSSMSDVALSNSSMLDVEQSNSNVSFVTQSNSSVSDVTQSNSSVSDVTQSNSSVSDVIQSNSSVSGVSDVADSNSNNTSDAYGDTANVNTTSNINTSTNDTAKVSSVNNRDSSVVTMDTSVNINNIASINYTSYGNVTNDVSPGSENFTSIDDTSNITTTYTFTETQNTTGNTSSSSSVTSVSDNVPSKPNDRPVDDSASTGTIIDTGSLQPLGGTLNGGDMGFTDTGDAGFVDTGTLDGGFGDLGFGTGDGFGDGFYEYGDICTQPPCNPPPTTPGPPTVKTSPLPPPPPPPPPPSNVFDSLIPKTERVPIRPPVQTIPREGPFTSQMAENLKKKIEDLRAQFFAFQNRNLHTGSSSGLNFFNPLSLLSQSKRAQTNKASFKTSVESNIRNNVIPNQQIFPGSAGDTINIQTNTIDRNMVPGVPNLAASTNAQTASVGRDNSVSGRGDTFSNLNIAPPPQTLSVLEATIQGNTRFTNAFKTGQPSQTISSKTPLAKRNSVSDSSHSPWPYNPSGFTSNRNVVRRPSVDPVLGTQSINVNTAGRLTNRQSNIVRENLPVRDPNLGTMSRSTSSSKTVVNNNVNAGPVSLSRGTNGANSVSIPSRSSNMVTSNAGPSSFSRQVQTKWIDTTSISGLPSTKPINTANVILPLPTSSNSVSKPQSTVTEIRSSSTNFDDLLFDRERGIVRNVKTVTNPMVTSSKSFSTNSNKGANSGKLNIGATMKNGQNFANIGSTIDQKPNVISKDSIPRTFVAIGSQFNQDSGVRSQSSGMNAQKDTNVLNTLLNVDPVRKFDSVDMNMGSDLNNIVHGGSAIRQSSPLTAVNMGSKFDQLSNTGIPVIRTDQSFGNPGIVFNSANTRNTVGTINSPQIPANTRSKFNTNSNSMTSHLARNSLSRTSIQNTGSNPSSLNNNNRPSARSPGIPMWNGANLGSTVFGNANSQGSGTSFLNPSRATNIGLRDSNIASARSFPSPLNDARRGSSSLTTDTRRTTSITDPSSQNSISGTSGPFHPTIILPPKPLQTGTNPSSSGSLNLPQPNPVQPPPTAIETIEMPPPPPSPSIKMNQETMMSAILSGQGLDGSVITTKRSPRFDTGISNQNNFPAVNQATAEGNNQAFLLNTNTVDVKFPQPESLISNTNKNINSIIDGNAGSLQKATGSETGQNANIGLSNQGTVATETTLQPNVVQGEVLERTTAASPLQSQTFLGVKNQQISSKRRRELPNAYQICKNCTFVNGFCYVEMPGNCNRFIECSRQGTEIRAFEKECSFRLFWNQRNITCQISYDVKCSSDPCGNSAVRNHPYIGKCRAYWTCKKGASNARCCPKGYGYGGTAGKKECVPMATCNDECVTKPTKEEKQVRDECLLMEDPRSPHRYIEGGHSMPCAPGTQFNQKVCTCTQSNTVDSAPLPTVCSKDLFLNFEEGTGGEFRDKSGKGSIIETSNVITDVARGIAKFNQNGRIKVWKYANLKMGSALAITLKFLPFRGNSRWQTLLSNCNDQDKMAAIEITLDTVFSDVVFKVETVGSPDSRVNEIKIKYKPFHWNDVVLVYKQGSFAAAVDTLSDFKFIQGHIPNRHPAISLGGCGQTSRKGFIGHIDDVSIYNGCIPTDLESQYLFG